MKPLPVIAAAGAEDEQKIVLCSSPRALQTPSSVETYFHKCLMNKAVRNK